MIQENEIIMCVLGAGALAFLLAAQVHLKRTPGFAILVIAFCGLALGWVATVLEGFVWPVGLNVLEHACYAASGISLAVWCVHVFHRGREARS